LPQAKAVLGSTKNDLSALDGEIKREIGFALWELQNGGMPTGCERLRGYRAGTLEIKADHDTDTYRIVLAICFAECIYVLHVYKKKSHTGSEAPREHKNTINVRLKEAEQRHALIPKEQRKLRRQ
jgi:phage-related protein